MLKYPASRGVQPASHLTRIEATRCEVHGDHAHEPMVTLCVDCLRTGDGMAGFASTVSPEPVVEMAGFNAWMYPATVSRLAKALVRFVAGISHARTVPELLAGGSLRVGSYSPVQPEGAPGVNPSLKVAGFESTLPGWFWPTPDINCTKDTGQFHMTATNRLTHGIPKFDRQFINDPLRVPLRRDNGNTSHILPK